MINASLLKVCVSCERRDAVAGYLSLETTNARMYDIRGDKLSERIAGTGSGTVCLKRSKYRISAKASIWQNLMPSCILQYTIPSRNHCIRLKRMVNFRSVDQCEYVGFHISSPESMPSSIIAPSAVSNAYMVLLGHLLAWWSNGRWLP